MFGSKMTQNVLLAAGLGSAIKAGADYITGGKSFMEFTGLQDTAIGRFFDSPQGQFATKVGKGIVGGAAEAFFDEREGIGANPAGSKTQLVSSQRFKSNRLQGASRYGPPQGSKNIIDNAMDRVDVQDIAFKYTQARIPDRKIAGQTMQIAGVRGLGSLKKGVIKSIRD